MKVALIPPLGWEQYMRFSTGVQMSLAIEHCMMSSGYVHAFKEASAKGDLVILDNGEAEGVRQRSNVLTRFANTVEARELVIPDVMGERRATQERVSQFFQSPNAYTPTMQYMAVAQGEDLEQTKLAVHYFANFYISHPVFGSFQPIHTIGIPRNLCHLTGNPSVRIDLANWIQNEYGQKFQIHFLGAYGRWPQEVRSVKLYAPNVRSIDTSLPFNYALRGRILEIGRGGMEHTPPSRPENYLRGDLENIYQRLVTTNITNYIRWAS